MNKVYSKNVTMKDIALKAGVSINAVSKALRDCEDISIEKKEQIRAIAKELGYVPNSVAVNLRNGASNYIALVFNDFYNPYFTVFCDKVLKKMRNKDYKCQLVFCDSAIMDMSNIQSVLISNFRGVISFVEPTDEVATFFKQRNLPFTLVGIKSYNKNIDCIYTDDYSGGLQVAEYFVNGEYKNALYITNSLSETNDRRKNGFIDFCKEYDKNYFFKDTFSNTEEEIYNFIIEKNIDFIFSFSDSLAIHLKNYLKKKKYSHTIKIIGFDNLHKYCSYIQRIDSVSSNMDEIIDFACNQIIKKINLEIDINTHIEKMFPTHLSIKKK